MKPSFFEWKIFLVSLLTALTPAGAAYAAGTSSGGGGGGSGIACFRTQDDADRARQARLGQLPLPADLLPEIVSLQTTEVAEHLGAGFVQPNDGESASDYIGRVLAAHIGQSAPSLLQRIQYFSNLTSLSSGMVDRKQQLAQIDDTGTILNVDVEHGSCALVQVVVRQVDLAARRVTISIDKDLFDKLGLDISNATDEKKRARAQVLNQAALQLHEALYMMSYGLGETTSAKARNTVGVLLSQLKFDIYNKAAHAHGVKQENVVAYDMIHEIYFDGFADFTISYFTNVNPVRLQWIDAYKSYEKKFYAAVNANAGGSKSMYDCWAQTKGTEAFIAVAEIAEIGGELPDFFTLLDPAQDANFEAEQVCVYARNLAHADLPNVTGDEKKIFQGVGQEAVAYCKTIEHPAP